MEMLKEAGLFLATRLYRHQLPNREEGCPNEKRLPNERRLPKREENIPAIPRPALTLQVACGYCLYQEILLVAVALAPR